MRKRILALILVLTTYQSLLAQNVGIGTNSPVNKLSVNGKVNITDSLGIGTTNPAGELDVKSTNISVSTIDQQQTVIFGDVNGASRWQSFTAGVTGLLPKIDLYISSPTMPSSSAGTIKIYAGEGISGTLLSTTTVTYQPGLAWRSFTLSNLVNVIAGNKYTLNVTAPVANNSWVGLTNNNPYAGGVSDFHPNYDFVFKTYVVVPSILDALVVANGNVGIGITAPVSKLDIAGNIKITDGTQGTGKVLISDANGLASWANPSLGSGTAAGNTIYWNGTSWVTNSANIYNNGTNVGIGTTTPSSKLDIAGNIKITDGTQGTGKVLTSDANGLASWGTATGLTGNGTVAGNTTYWNGTSWVTNSSNIYNNGTNVGIGTATPAKKLSVNGSMDITDSLGIGTTSPGGELHVRSKNMLANTIDQQQTSVAYSAGGTTQWQSFTAGITGLLTKVDLSVGSPKAPFTSPGTINIYNGEGVSGTLLSTTTVTYQAISSAFQSFTLSGTVNVIAGNKYTIQFNAPSMNVAWVDLDDTNPYAGGLSNTNSNTDYLFKTYVSPFGVLEALVVSNGNVGIGTATPSSKLDIIGNVKITDGTQGAGKVLTSDANGLASWSTPTGGGLGAGSSAGNTPYWNGTAWVTNSSNIYNNGGNVGIGTSSPAANLDVVSSGTTGAAGQIKLTAPNVTAGNITAIAQGKSATLANQAEWRFEYAGPGSLSNAHSFGFNGIQPFVYFTAGQNVGIGTSAPTAKLSVNGIANNTTGAWGVFSDARIKTINSDFTDGLNVINKIHPVRFNYNDNAPFKADGEQIGIVAQELEKIAPYMVSQKETMSVKNLREVNNQAYIFLLINAVKELSVQNEQLKAQNEKFKADLELIKAKLGL